jgi:hypothetical protein
MNSIKVKKASGKLEPFSADKVRQSLKRAGAQPKVIDQIIAQITPKLHDVISTKEIYQQVFNLLNQLQKNHGYRYSLKQSLMQLGPSGYPFERFVARLLDHHGYKTQSPLLIQGQCIKHEIDVVAEKDNQKYMIECKFHNRAGIKTDAKVALYVQARFQDLKDFHQPWLITNTKLTQSAINYGRCKNMNLLAWRYPKDKGLETMIEAANLHPLTCLNFLTQKEKQILFDHNIVLCQDLSQTNPKLLASWGLDQQKILQIKDVLVSILGQ